MTTWSLPVSTPDFEEAAWKPQYWENVLSGLAIRFSFATKSGSTSIVCPVTALVHEVVLPDRLLITFKNTGACQPFNEQDQKPNYGPALGLVNGIVFQDEFQCGTLIESWDGKRHYDCRIPTGAGTATETTLDTTVSEDVKRLAGGFPIGIRKLDYPRAWLHGRLQIIGSSFETNGRNGGVP